MLKHTPADLALGDVAADVIFRSIGVQRDLGPVEHHQQFGLVGVQPREQAVEGDEAGVALEDAIEARPQGGLMLFAGIAAIMFQITVELPDQVTDGGLGGAALVREGVELVNQALGMNPA